MLVLIAALPYNDVFQSPYDPPRRVLIEIHLSPRKHLDCDREDDLGVHPFVVHSTVYSF